MNKRYLSICFVLSFFYQCLVVCNSKNFTSLVRFIPKYFIVFDAIVARILFSDIQLIVECTAVIYIQVSFYMLILHPETLLKLLTSSSSVLGLWDFLYVRSYNLQKKKKKGNFISSSFPVWKSFISFSFPISLAKISSTLLNRNVRVGVLVLFLILDKYLTFYH